MYTFGYLMTDKHIQNLRHVVLHGTALRYVTYHGKCTA